MDELRLQGLELSLSAVLGRGVSASGSYSRIDGENRLDPEQTVTESYGSKLIAALRYDDPDDRFHVEARLRRQGDRDDLELDGSVVGPTLPGFTTAALEAAISLPGDQRMSVRVENLTDELYAEALNVGFFRPEPGRHLEVGWSWRF